MRLGIRVKEAVAVTLLVLLIVVTTTLIQLSHLSRVVVQEALRPLMDTRTVIMATHRPALLELAHRVIEIDGGRVVGERGLGEEAS